MPSRTGMSLKLFWETGWNSSLLNLRWVSWGCVLTRASHLSPFFFLSFFFSPCDLASSSPFTSSVLPSHSFWFQLCDNDHVRISFGWFANTTGLRKACLNSDPLGLWGNVMTSSLLYFVDSSLTYSNLNKDSLILTRLIDEITIVGILKQIVQISIAVYVKAAL